MTVNKVNKILHTLLLFFLSAIATSQNVTIKGILENGNFDKVRIYVHDDEFSELKKEIASTFTDEHGNFDIKININKIKFALIKKGLKEGEFYLSPNSKFDFTIYPDTAKEVSVFQNKRLNFTFKADDKGLNDSIASFNYLYNVFMIDNFSNPYQGNKKAAVTGFKEQIHNRFKDFNNDYFKIYVKYTLAQLDQIGKTKSLKTILKDYFVNEKIHYDNIQYAAFFEEFFEDYIHRYYYNRYLNDFRQAVYTGSYKEIDSLLKKDEYLISNGQLRELVLINTLKMFYYDRAFSRKGVLKILNNIAGNSKYPVHKKIAENYTIKLTKLAHGTPAPPFSLPMSNGKEFNLKNLKESFTILDFLKADCNICLAHIDFLKDLSSRFGSKVEIVILVYGKNPEKIKQLLNSEAVNWPVLFVGKRIDVLDAYDVSVFPTYIILNPDLTIGMAPAPMADENLEKELNILMFNWERKENGHR